MPTELFIFEGPDNTYWTECPGRWTTDRAEATTFTSEQVNDCFALPEGDLYKWTKLTLVSCRTIWNGEKKLADGQEWPTHYWATATRTKPTQPARYRPGDAVQKKLSDGLRTVVSIEFYRYAAHPPEPIYILDDGSRCFNHHLH